MLKQVASEIWISGVLKKKESGALFGYSASLVSFLFFCAGRRDSHVLLVVLP